jgi:hypothetical protein
MSDETYYDPRTPPEVRAVLERVRGTGERVRLFLGDPDTGRDWNEEHDVAGRIGRSTGPTKVPLLIASRRSMGGPQLLDYCIVRITTTTQPYRELYRHPTYHSLPFHLMQLVPAGEPPTSKTGYRVEVRRDGQPHAMFRRRSQALRWLAKMRVPFEEVTP